MTVFLDYQFQIEGISPSKPMSSPVQQSAPIVLEILLRQKEKAMPNILPVYPQFPLSYWGFQFTMEFVGRKACMPPLGLVTVAGMFPRETYILRVVDMNVKTLMDEHLAWADMVMTSTMIVQ